METVFPGVAAQFRKDAEVHRKAHKIEPMFGLFWTFCLNAYFPGQDRVHCLPHADKKNQIGVCVVLTYALPSGSVHFLHALSATDPIQTSSMTLYGHGL